MGSLNSFKKKLDLLEAMLSKISSSNIRIRELKKSIYVLRLLLDRPKDIKSPYGPATPIIKFSLN